MRFFAFEPYKKTHLLVDEKKDQAIQRVERGALFREPDRQIGRQVGTVRILSRLSRKANGVYKWRPDSAVCSGHEVDDVDGLCISCNQISPDARSMRCLSLSAVTALFAIAHWRYPEATLTRDTDHAQADAVARNHLSCWLSGAHANRQPTNGLGRSLGAIPQ
ncbi:hypothetical protein D3C81_326700 [compost metagenome]